LQLWQREAGDVLDYESIIPVAFVPLRGKPMAGAMKSGWKDE
jgi:hypothetical protein